MMETIHFRNSRVVCNDSAVPLASIRVDGDRIVALAELPDQATDCEYNHEGVILSPGFIDVHNHGAVGIDVNEADVDGLLKIAGFLARRGVTAWVPTLVPDSEDNYRRSIAVIDELMVVQVGEPVAKAVGVHYEGVFANEKMCGALRPEFFRGGRSAVGGGQPVGSWQRVSSPHVSKGNAGSEIAHPATDTVAEERTTPSAQSGGHPSFIRRGVDGDAPPATAGGTDRRGVCGLPMLKSGVHMTTLAPEIEGGIELIEALVAEGWVVAIGHTRADVETLDRAFAAGARHLTHFFNAMTGVHHRDIGVAGWGLANVGVTFDIIADGIHVHPKMLGVACRAKSVEKVSLISDSVAPTGLGDGEFQLWGETITVENGRTRNERGSIAGSVIAMDDAVRTMLGLGFDGAEIAAMASTNPARLLSIEATHGSIEIGKRADLVGLDAEGNVEFTMIDGEFVYQNLRPV